jgi:hypothetical protein
MYSEDMADQISGIQPDADNLLYEELREIDRQAGVEGTLTHEEVFAEARQWVSELNTLDELEKTSLR